MPSVDQGLLRAVQGASPDGAVAWLLREAVLRNLRWVGAGTVLPSNIWSRAAAREMGVNSSAGPGRRGALTSSQVREGLACRGAALNFISVFLSGSPQDRTAEAQQQNHSG